MPANGARHQAKLLCQPRYFTGKPCSKGHVSERKTGSGACVQCFNEHHARRRKRKAAEDPEGYKAAKRAEYQRNRETYRKSQRRYSAEHADDARARAKDWYHANKDRAKARKAAYYEANPLLWTASNHNKKARVNGVPGAFTAADLDALWASQNGRCAYCCSELDMTGRTIDHIVPIARGGSNETWNICWACPPCNRRKWNKTGDEFRAELAEPLIP